MGREKSEPEIKVGQGVRLKSKSEEMVVLSIDSKEGMVKCIWQMYGVNVFKDFRKEDLRSVEEA